MMHLAHQEGIKLHHCCTHSCCMHVFGMYAAVALATEARLSVSNGAGGRAGIVVCMHCIVVGIMHALA